MISAIADTQDENIV
jgi:hypothetical protein